MTKCLECGCPNMMHTILDEWVEDLGGVTVKLFDAVHCYTCQKCGNRETEIPHLKSLVRTAAIARALIPVKLSGPEIRFMRRALDMTQEEFGDAMGVGAKETVSRWETDAKGMGEFTEKTIRHNICALLHEQEPSFAYNPADITKMRVHELEEGVVLAPIELQLVRVAMNNVRQDAWDRLAA